MYNFKRYLLLFAILPFIMQCDKDGEKDPNAIDLPSGTGHELLSEYNFFEGNVADLTPNAIAGVLPYDLNMPLFSDYASKKRWVYVPEGSSIPFETTSTLDLPTGSVLIKHFYYPEGNGTDNYIETRLLIKRSSGWQPETYKWNDAQTDATRTVLGGTQNLTVNVNGQMETFNYSIPNVNQCKNCHAFNGSIEPIGPVIQNLNSNYDYADGTANQVQTWIDKGILDNTSIANIPAWPKMEDATASLNEKARSYLAVNCSSCHRLEGSAANSGLYLEYSNNDSLSLGFLKTPVAAGAGSGGFTHVIEPGDADQSILLFRMISDELNARMPELGRELGHEEGIQLIRDWIDAQ